MQRTTHASFHDRANDLPLPVIADRRGPRTRRARVRLGLLAAVACLLLAGCGSSTATADPQTEDGEPRLNQMIALGSGTPIPAGRWGAEIDGVNLEVRPEQTLETVSYNYGFSGRPPTRLIFETIPPDDLNAFFVVPFEGFVDGIDMRTPTSDDPLTAEELINGLSQAVELTDVTDSSIGGQPSITWQWGPLDPNSAFACGDDDRSDLDDDDLCIRYGAAGERTVQYATQSIAWNLHYVESAGMVVAWVYNDTGADDPFSELADALLINP